MKADKTKFKIPQLIIAHCSLFVAFTALASADFKIDPSVMSEKYWQIWNDAEQAKIDADIEANRKADGEFVIDAPAGTEVKVEMLDHEFKFGAHIFNYDQLGKKEYNDAYKASYGQGGLFNSATVAFYWDCYEPISGRIRPYGDYEDTERFWNSISREEAMDHKFWRRPAPGTVVNFCKEKNIRIHGHILIWGSAKPFWIYDLWCPENEKRECDKLGIPRNGMETVETDNWEGGYKFAWKAAWEKAYKRTTEKELAAKMPEFTANMRKLFHDRVFGVASFFGNFVDSWDVVNESSKDWARYRKSRTNLPVWFSTYGLMPGDYPLWALLDAKEAFPARAKLNINDYNICNDFLTQVNELQQEGAKIDIVGCQMHIFDTNACARLAQGGSCGNWIDTPQMIQDRLDMMAKTGKPIHVSEITITSPGPDYKSRMIQAILTRNAYRKWFSHKSMMGITWWNTVDGGGVKGEPLVSGLFTTDMKKKPAYEALDQLINHEWKTRLTAKVEVGGNGDNVIRFRGFRGKYRLTWEDELGTIHYREAYLTGDGVKETAKDSWSLVRKLSDAEIPQDHLKVVPAVKAYGPVALDVVRAKTVAEIAAVAKSAPITIKLGEKPADILDLVKNSGFVFGQEGRDAIYMSFKVKSPRKLKTFIYEKCDWYGALFVNGRQVEETAGDTAHWTGVPVVLEEGENEVVFRFTSGTAGWGATLAVRDPANELVFQ